MEAGKDAGASAAAVHKTPEKQESGGGKNVGGSEADMRSKLAAWKEQQQRAKTEGTKGKSVVAVSTGSVLVCMVCVCGAKSFSTQGTYMFDSWLDHSILKYHHTTHGSLEHT